MKRVALFSLLLTLVISCTAPNGAVFASYETSTESTQLEPLSEEMILPEDSPSSLPLVLSGEAEEYTEPPVESLSAPSLPRQEIALPETPSVTSPAIVLAQIQVGSSAGSSDEYVSIYNNGNEEVDVSGWCIRNKSRIFACLNEPNTDYSIDPGAYIGFSGLPNRPGDHGLVAAFLPGSNQIVASSDTIQIINGDSVIDEIAWKTSPPASHFAIERLWEEGQTGRLRAGEESWEWKKLLSVHGRILEHVECGGGVLVLEGEKCPVLNTCKGVVISEIAANVEEQFIELHNLASESIDITGCKVQTNRNTQTYIFPENTLLHAGDFEVVNIADTNLTLTKTTAGTVYLLSSDGQIETDSVTYRNLSKDTSWALMGNSWVQTYIITPGSNNVYSQYLPCEEGYLRNADTGRCIKIVEPAVVTDCGEGRERNTATGRCRTIVTLSTLQPCRDGQYRSEETNRCRSIAPAGGTLKPCKEGQYRSEETNRCRSVAAAAASVLKPCADDQFRNPATNRCKKIATADDIALADCGEGRERNPATNRCRNVLGTSALTDTMPFPVEEVEDSRESFVGWLTLGIVVVAGASYGLWEWRYELIGAGRRFGHFIARSK